MQLTTSAQHHSNIPSASANYECEDDTRQTHKNWWKNNVDVVNALYPLSLWLNQQSDHLTIISPQPPSNPSIQLPECQPSIHLIVLPSIHPLDTLPSPFKHLLPFICGYCCRCHCPTLNRSTHINSMNEWMNMRAFSLELVKRDRKYLICLFLFFFISFRLLFFCFTRNITCRNKVREIE